MLTAVRWTEPVHPTEDVPRNWNGATLPAGCKLPLIIQRFAQRVRPLGMVGVPKGTNVPRY